MINTTNLGALADFLGATRPSINMSSWGSCVCGRYTEHRAKLEGRTLNQSEIFAEAQQVSRRVFGLELGTPAGDFCFGSQWGNESFHDVINDLDAAIDRVRYVALHGDAPDASQWKRFEKHPQPVVEIEAAEVCEPAAA